ncbi:late embryogenesis abundant protein 6-like [Telopea speciosissima]|uniref:late embryogenesis abundant protein 6-like n=1 Tax=Telopea speciosissima TaxID=54955 RepID=UPI001CC59D96|nr:late embryogenesis abundant protein 6-like [Telopea speciosissima]
MQTIKEKFQDMREMREAKAEAKAEEQAEKELAKARLDVAHEVRKAREAEAEMDLHVNKAVEKADKEIAKHHELGTDEPIVGITDDRQDNLPMSSGGNPNLGTMGTTNINTNNMTNSAGADRNPKLF